MQIEIEEADGSVGYLTWNEFDRFRRAVENSRRYVPWLRVAGYIKLGADPDELMSRSSHRLNMPLGLPATWLAAEEITQLLYEVNRWNTLEDVAKRGSEFALQLTREVETAVARWPMEQHPRDVKFFRCMACNKATLRYYPPALHDGEIVGVTVKCTDPICRAVVDELMFMRMAIMQEAEEKERQERARRLDSDEAGTETGQQVDSHDLPVVEGGPDPYHAPSADPVALSPRSAQG